MFFVGKVNNANRMPPPLHLYTLAAELRHALNVRQPRPISRLVRLPSIAIVTIATFVTKNRSMNLHKYSKIFREYWDRFIFFFFFFMKLRAKSSCINFSYVSQPIIIYARTIFVLVRFIRTAVKRDDRLASFDLPR